MIMFFKRLFARKEKPVAEPMHGSAAVQTQAEQDATRERMEAEMAADRERRGEAGQPEEQGSGSAETGDTA